MKPGWGEGSRESVTLNRLALDTVKFRTDYLFGELFLLKLVKRGFVDFLVHWHRVFIGY
jgi:hypothetical protein